MSQFDAGEVAENAASKTIERALQSVYEPLSTFIGVSRSKFFEDFGKYYSYMFQKSAYVRTILSAGSAVSISEMYTPSRFRKDNEEYTDKYLIGQIRDLDRVVIKGNGGSGKTVFFKYLWLACFNEPNGKIPISIELRRLNEMTVVDLISFCRSELQSNSIFSDSVFKKLCDEGKFIFIFDGFDELKREIRKEVESQVIAMSYSYTKCGFVVSSRDDDRFNAWQGFDIYSVCKLSLIEVKELIGKLTFDLKTKKKFVALLTEDFFKENEHFLSSPLLCTMMLMTYFQNASIPDRLSAFYRNALMTMLLWHDATKDSFERQRTLSQDNFCTLFSVFSFITYYDGEHEFEEADLRKYLAKSIDYVRRLEEFSHIKNIDVDDVKLDFWQSANLLQKDGLVYFFLHRSFQEYFSADFAMSILNDNVEKVLTLFASRRFDRTLEMCYEIQEDKVIDEFLKPTLAKLTSMGLFASTGNDEETPFFVQLDIEMKTAGGEITTLDSLGGMPDPDGSGTASFLYKLCEVIGVKLNTGLDGRLISEFANIYTSDELAGLRSSNYKLKITSDIRGKVKVDIDLLDDNFGALDRKSISRFVNLLRGKLEPMIPLSEKACRDNLSTIQTQLTQIISDRDNRSESIKDILGL